MGVSMCVYVCVAFDLRRSTISSGGSSFEYLLITPMIPAAKGSCS